MSSEKLKKYLAYYQQTLRDDPENIEARLRLASLFREMGHKSQAIDEYVTASKLLASQGLPLEAIAACKAVLEIDPTHTEVQLFLARLFAQAPDAAGARVARPVASSPQSAPSQAASSPLVMTSPQAQSPASSPLGETSRRREPSPSAPITLGRPKVATPAPQPTQQRAASPAPPVTAPASASASTLAQTPTDSPQPPRSPALGRDAGATPLHDEPLREPVEEAPTGRFKSLKARQVGAEPLTSQSAPTRASLPALSTALIEATRVASEPLPEATRAAASSPPLDETRSMMEVAPQLMEELRRTTEMDAHLRRTVEFSYLDELRETQALSLPGLSTLEESTSPTARQGLASGGFSSGLVRPSARAESFELKLFEPDDDAVHQDEQLLAMSSLGATRQDALPELAALIDAPTARLDRASIMTALSADLPEIPLLSHLGPRSFVELITMAQLDHVERGQVILAPGHQRRSLFIIISGQVAISKTHDQAQVNLSVMGAGDFFGEFGLLTGRDHSATVTATEPARLLVLSEEAIHHVAQEDPEIWDTLWAYYHVRMLNNLMSSHAILGKLSAQERDALLPQFEAREYDEGDIILQPELPCPCVYMVLFGAVELRPTRGPSSVTTLREGEFFGFLPCLTDEPGHTQVTSTRETTVLSLPARVFRQLTRQNKQVALALRDLLRSLPSRDSLFLTRR